MAPAEAACAFSKIDCQRLADFCRCFGAGLVPKGAPQGGSRGVLGVGSWGHDSPKTPQDAPRPGMRSTLLCGWLFTCFLPLFDPMSEPKMWLPLRRRAHFPKIDCQRLADFCKCFGAGGILGVGSWGHNSPKTPQDAPRPRMRSTLLCGWLVRCRLPLFDPVSEPKMWLPLRRRKHFPTNDWQRLHRP